MRFAVRETIGATRGYLLACTATGVTPLSKFHTSPVHQKGNQQRKTKMKAKKWVLVKAFDGEPKDSDIELQEEELQPLKENGTLR